jgi:hypothetical protein
VAAITNRAPKGIVGKMIDWRHKITKWRQRIHASADETAEREPAPALKFSERNTRSTDTTFTQRGEK